MKGLPFVLLFTAMTFVSWGVYGPTLHHGAVALQHDSLRAFVGVGLAYFMIAVLIPFLILKQTGESGKWTASGVIYSVIAGAVGAIGALGIILALGYGGKTVYVMPLVFGFAPIVNTLVTAFLSRTFNEISAIFIGGVVAAALGAAGVLYFKPAPPSASNNHTATVAESPSTASLEPTPSATPSADAAESVEPSSGSSVQSTEVEEDAQVAEQSRAAQESSNAADAQDPSGDAEAHAESAAGRSGMHGEGHSNVPASAPLSVPGVVISIVIAAVCWGSYGPMLHIGQGKMQGSRLRPFACVGLAYFLIAVVVPLALIYSRASDSGSWNVSGLTWSFLAGVAGAIGALGVILAFNAGGKPYYVMPLIFGFAPVINTFTSLSEAGTWGLVTPMFWVSLAVVIAGAVTVLTNAPKPKPKPGH